MKVSAVVLTGLMASAASAYRLDVHSEYNFLGTQKTYVCASKFCPASFLSPTHTVLEYDTRMLT
jgi:hypothetical protein